ncbi:MAG TPA: hypothetical protein VF017_10650 [Thermoanaerobaculia bacterium]|nr:hypothetical protein [Thermoanaerobaculia bacterium]
MPQLHFYVPNDTATDLRSQAESRGLSLSAYLAEMVTTKAAQGWPAGWFEAVVGGWYGEPFERAPQLPFEERRTL